MSIQINAIQFAGAPNTVSGNAIRVRKNANETIPIPEWSSDRPNIYENSAAVYVINSNRNKTLRIKAKFSSSLAALRNQEVEIRALQPPAHLVLRPQLLVNSHINVLGEINPHKVSFDKNGKTGMENFELNNHRLSVRGVGISPVIWHWQFRLAPNQPWQNLETTIHKIYTILELPKGPWTQNATDAIHLPWTDVLDYSCTWANQAQTVNQAASRITEAVYNLGPELVEYNCVNFLPAYVIPINIWGDSYFDCSAFLTHLKTGLVNRFIICTDCACIVSTFANALGCNLWQSKMYTQGVNFFKINPILAIGNLQWNLPCGISGFSYHEVAWADECNVNNEVYDACLAIDQGVNPSFFPHFAYLPIDLKFGQPGEGLYRDRLAFPTDVLLCNPQPGDRQQRRLTPVVFTSPGPLLQKALPFQDDRCQLLKERLNFEEWDNQNQLGENLLIFNHQIPDQSLKNWKPLYSRQSTTKTNRPLVIDDLWRPSASAPYRAIKITKYESNSRREAHELLVRLMSNAHLAVDYHRIKDLGDIAFGGPRNQSVLFARGNVVIALSNADRIEMDLVAHAKKIDQSFCDRKEHLPASDALLKAKAKTKPKAVPIKLVKAKDGKMRIDFQQGLKAKATQLAKATAQPSLNNLRLFSTDGELVIENEELVFIPHNKKAKPKVAVYFQQDDQAGEVVL